MRSCRRRGRCWARENALALAQPHALLLRLNWPGQGLGGDADGLACVDADGWIVASNGTARQLLPQLTQAGAAPVHCSEVFAMPWENLFDAVRYGNPFDAPLWAGLVLQVLAQAPGHAPRPAVKAAPQLPLKDQETALIRKAVADARGNVMQAARMLGISRATVYRKLAGKIGR